MEILLILIAGPALIGALLCRFTTLHPLISGLALWIVGTALVFVVLAGFLVTDGLVAAPIIALLPACAGALGGFLGWLRRKHVERTN